MKSNFNLRRNVVFSTQVFKGVYWVPLNTLGGSKYSNVRMKIISLLKKICYFSNKDIIERINTVSEVVQFLQISNFKVKNDNEFFYKDGVEWELHKSGNDGLNNNKGCCASVAATICTLLKDNYNSVKIIVIIALKGSCHVLNYIESNGKKYIVDVYAMTNRYKKFVPNETGKLSDFVSSKLHTGVLLEIDDLQHFFDFYRRYFIKRNDCYDFFLVDDEVVPCTSLNRNAHSINFIIKGRNMYLVSKDKKEHGLTVKYM